MKNLFNRAAFSFLMFGMLSFLVSCDTEPAMENTTLESDYSLLEVFNKVNELNQGKAPSPKKEEDAIAAIAVQAGFNELVQSLVYVDTNLGTNLVDLFSNGTDQYTVFAPTDSAFQDLYAILGVSGVTDLNPELVKNVLLYHVTDGRRATNSVVPKKNNRVITSLLGSEFEVTPAPQIMAIGNTASFIATDFSASNGIIHVIDTVLLPIEL